MHEGLVGERALVGQPYLRDPELRQEYAAEIAPRTEVALAKVLREVFGEPAARVVRVLDLGAGTGAAGAAVRAFFGAGAEIVSVDRVAGLGTILADVGAPGPIRGVAGRFDLIVAAHLLNELFLAMPPAERASARTERVRAWCETLLAPGGTMVILEPALRETSRELLAVRDQLVAGGLHVVAPCSVAGALSRARARSRLVPRRDLRTAAGHRPAPAPRRLRVPGAAHGRLAVARPIAVPRGQRPARGKRPPAPLRLRPRRPPPAGAPGPAPHGIKRRLCRGRTWRPDPCPRDDDRRRRPTGRCGSSGRKAPVPELLR